jgi:phosphoribosylamine-glycine ligase
MKIEFEEQATVVVYKVPPNYGGYASVFPDRVNQNETDEPVDLSGALKLDEKFGSRIRVFPASLELREGHTYALKSRTVCVVGVGDDIQSAREVSLEGIRAIKGGALWHRNDIASKEHIGKSVRHMAKLRTL